MTTVRQNGFTLVEMMVALFLFSLVAATGVGLLAFSVRAQASAQRLLDRAASERRMAALLTNDLMQALPRIARDTEGKPLRAFEGTDGKQPGLIMTYTRSGRSNPQDLPRPGIERVDIVFADGRLERRGYALADGAAPATTIMLADNLTGVALRYRDRDGWRARWDPARRDTLPRAVELTLTPRDRPALLSAFLVGTRTP